MSEITITQVKRLNDQTTVLWTTPNGQHTEHHDLTNCPDVPKEDFLEQLKLVESDLVARTGFGSKFGSGFTLTGISMTHNSAGRRQFVPTIKVDFGWGETGMAMSILLAPDAENKRTTGKNVLTEKEVTQIETLFKLGAQYAEGDRHQSKLALDDKEAA